MADDQDLQVNTTDYDLIRAREEAFGWMGLDAKRPRAWEQYGWPEDVSFFQLFRAYERGGPAYGAVHKLLDRCWQGRPRIKRPDEDAVSDWEKGVDKLFKSIKAWTKLRDFDRRNMVGRYSALIYRVADGLPLDQPLKRATKLVDIVPLYEDQIKPIRWETDQASPDFGKVTMWQYRSVSSMAQFDTAGQPAQWQDVHPSRVQILAEGAVGNFYEGVPLLKAGFNHLVDLEKVSGGSAESFLKNSARSLVIKFDKEASPQVITQNADGSASTKSVREVVEDQTRRLNKNQDASIVLQGADASTLQTTFVDPTGAFHLAANLFAASVQIPFTILFGQQTGRLASDEDQKDMNARCESRQENELTPMVEEFVMRMQAAGIIEAGDFEIEWPPLGAPGDAEKADVLGKLTTAMQQAFQAGLAQPLFTGDELRNVVGFEEQDPLPMGEGDPAQQPAGAQPPAVAGQQQAPAPQPIPIRSARAAP